VRGVPIHPLKRALAALSVFAVLGLSSDAADARPPPADARPPRADCRRPRRVVDDAAAPRVVLLGIDRRFACALQTALDPWGLRLIESDAASPGSSMPSTSLSARAIALEHGARAVIWLGQDPAGYALWVYDADSDRSVSRPVPEPPYRSSVSASLALSVKTTLMMVGFASEPPAREEPPPAARDEPASPPAEPEPEPAPRPAPRWQLGVHGGVQLGPLDGVKQDVRYGLGLRWSPAPIGLHPGLELELAAGLPLSVRSPQIEGRIWDAASALALGVTEPLTRVWAVSVSGAAALHVTSLSGTATMDGVHVDDLRANPTLRLGAELSANLGVLALGLEPSFEVWLNAQRYEANSEPVLDHRRRAFALALAVWVPLD
jgi:hypothetical protein